MEYLYIILLGIVAGFLAGYLFKGGGYGLIVNLILGIVGAFFGSWVFGALGISIGSGILGQLITATIGAILILIIVNLISRNT